MKRQLLLAMCLGLSACGEDQPATTSSDAGSDVAIEAGPHGPLGFAPSNVPEAKLDFTGLGDLIYDADQCGNTLSLTDSMVTQCDGQGTKYRSFELVDGKEHYTVFVAKNIRIDAGQLVTISGTRAIILVAENTIEINGHLDAAPGLAGGAVQTGDTKGAGPGGGKFDGTPAPRGGGGGFCGKGGNTGASLALGGDSYGTPSITPLLGGSSGGGPFSGAGGAAIQLVAGQQIKIGGTGRIYVPGGGGHSALNLGGGGGSGGSILLESRDIIVLGTLAANGGGGGSNNGGGDGENGKPSAEPAKGDTAGPEGAGGAGAAGSVVLGGNGTGAADQAGNGGGGAGYIRLNTASGAATISGTVSPAVGTTCLTQGRITL